MKIAEAKGTVHISSARPYFPPDEVERILLELQETLGSGVLTQGPRVREFEALFAQLVGTDHAVAVSNGTAALEIALRAFGLKGEEVIVPTNTFLASANAVIFAGGRPVFSDIDAKSLCVGLDQIRERVTERTRGLMLVHIAGLICPEIAEILEFARARGLFVIEDAAHAHGAEWNQRKAGAMGDIGAFSFFPTKVMTTCEGGMITTSNSQLALFSRTFRNHGVPEGKRTHEQLGHNCRLDEVRAILGLSQLRTLPEALKKRREIASRYQEGLRGVEGIGFIELPAGSLSSYYKYPIVIATARRRNQIAFALKEVHQIDTGTVYWPPCHLHPVVQSRNDLYGVSGAMPIAEQVLPRVLCLPIHPLLDAAAVGRVTEAVKLEMEHTRDS